VPCRRGESGLHHKTDTKLVEKLFKPNKLQADKYSVIGWLLRKRGKEKGGAYCTAVVSFPEESER
jgi:hypothetical protein